MGRTHVKRVVEEQFDWEGFDALLGHNARSDVKFLNTFSILALIYEHFGLDLIGLGIVWPPRHTRGCNYY